YIDGRWLDTPVAPAIDYRSAQPKQELYALIRQRLDAVLDQRHNLARAGLPADQHAALQRLAGLQGRRISLLPDTALLSVMHGEDMQVFTLLRDSAHKNLSSLFAEDRRRLPSEDRLTVVPGIIAAYPNAFYRVRSADVPDFVEAVIGLRSERHYRRLLDRFGVRRTDPQFWSHSDRLHAFYRQH